MAYSVQVILPNISAGIDVSIKRRMISDPKPKRETSKRYLEYIKTLPCACKDHTCTGDVVPHHTKTKGAGGSDFMTVPLCYTHHAMAHNLGRESFAITAGILIEENIIGYLIGYIKKLEGE